MEPLLFYFICIFIVIVIIVLIDIDKQNEKQEKNRKEYEKACKEEEKYYYEETKKLFKKFLLEKIKSDLKSNADKNGYFVLSENFLEDFEIAIYNYHNLMVMYYEDLIFENSLIPIIKNEAKRITEELFQDICFKQKTLWNTNEIFLSKLEQRFSKENRTLTFRIINESSELNKNQKIVYSYKQIIENYVNELKAEYFPIESRDEANDMKEDIDQYIQELNFLGNEDEYTVEEYINNATEDLNGYDIETCVIDDEDTDSFSFHPDVIPQPYRILKSFGKLKPSRFFYSNQEEYENDIKEWEEEFKQKYCYKNIIKILKYHIEMNKIYENVHQNLDLIEKESNNSIYKANKELCELNLSVCIPKLIENFLTSIVFPQFIHFDWSAKYDEESKILLVDLFLPDIKDFPCYKSCKRITKETKQIEFNTLSPKTIKENYNNFIYSVILNIIYNIFNLQVVIDDDVIKNAPLSEYINSIAINGNLKYIDESDGQPKENCILSIFTSREEFSKCNIQNVDYSKCFKRLKGLSAIDLSDNINVTPIIKFDTSDKRFIEGKDVLKNIDTSINLACINWQDFENLVRELFEKEFSNEGSEVKITQASHDGGVDAVVFDTDPIRGGKIIIQAKRYTNVVSVSAVRDLYGTVLNEGANKGILVTTSNYGSDAYNFAKDKPLTLLDGNQLLALLKKHGTSARIDIKEAKRLAIENQTQV